MMQRAIFGVVCAMLICSAVADMYMHNPPGCNDRNRERSDNRNNGNRIFDSQNNAKGGYSWRGDADTRAAPDPITYYAGSVLRLEWTNQHQCTGNNVQCQVIIQYACNDLMPGLRDGYPDSDNVVQSDDNNAGYTRREFNQNDGQNADGTNTISDTQFAGTGQRNQRLAYYYNVVSGNPGVQYGMHEGIDWYDLCKSTQRNRGLYHSDQNLNRNDARATRQNPNGNRNGLECPEERDYYPYWRPYLIHPQSTDNAGNTIFQPAAWFDVAILTNNPDTCGFYRDNSQNVRGYGQCLCDANCRTKIGTVSQGLIPWDETTCGLAQGNWVPNQGALGVGKPDCLQHDFGRDNNLGDSVGLDADGNPVNVRFQPETAHYLWTIPDRMAGNTCVVRMRYNISTNDYPNMNFATPGSLVKDFTSANDCTGQFAPSTEARKGNPPDATTLATIPASKAHCFGIFNETVKPLFNRPYIDIYGNGLGKIAIALNSDQSSRTFQDRSYVFKVAQKPSGVGSKTIWNLNTRGRRGNIVQCYPAVEYDFVPQKLNVPYGDFIHIQLHSSDFNAAKNANNGEGWQYSDRHNILQTSGPGDNFPLALSKQSLFNNANDNALAKRWALLEQPTNQCDFDFSNGNKNDQNNIRNCGKLNSAANRFPPNPVDGLIRMTNTGTYFYVSTRNNNFSNRSQKGMLVVGGSSGLSAAAQAGIAVGVIAACALAFGGVMYYGKKNPGSKAGGMYRGLAACVARGRAGANTTKTAAPMPDMEYQRS